MSKLSRLTLGSLAFLAIGSVQCVSKPNPPILGTQTSTTASERKIASLSQARSLGAECLAQLQGIPKANFDSKTGRLNQWPKTEVKEAFEHCLSAYLKIDTTNPPGDVAAAYEFWGAIFDGLGIPNQVVELDGNPQKGFGPKANFVASLAPSHLAANANPTYNWRSPNGVELPDESSILLLNHVDTVPVFADQWTSPDLPFSGKIMRHMSKESKREEEYIFGRGALDMKSVGMLQALSMALLKINSVPIKNTIHFLAVADEETGSYGAWRALLEMKVGGKLEALRHGRVVLNEGGAGIQKGFYPVFMIATEEKGGAWMRFRHPNFASLVDALKKMRLTMKLARTPSQDDVADPSSVASSASASPSGAANVRDLSSECSLVKYVTPGAAVNVVPSLAEVSIRCDRAPANSDAFKQIRAAFDAPHRSGHKHTSQITSNGELVEIKVSLQTSGHGSVGATSALFIAFDSLAELGLVKTNEALQNVKRPSFNDYRRTPATRDMLKSLTASFGIPFDLSNWLLDQKKLEQTGLRRIGRTVGFERLFRTACSWTAIHFEPGQPSEALVDCRISHTWDVKPSPEDHGAYFVTELRKFLGDSQLTIEPESSWNFTRSSAEAYEYKLISQEIRRGDSKAIVGSMLFPAGSDSTLFRDPRSAGLRTRPMLTYGFYPVVLSQELSATFHGSDERFPTAETDRATRIHFDVVRALARATLSTYSHEEASDIAVNRAQVEADYCATNGCTLPELSCETYEMAAKQETEVFKRSFLAALQSEQLAIDLKLCRSKLLPANCHPRKVLLRRKKADCLKSDQAFKALNK